jgi:hypothetical protein
MCLIRLSSEKKPYEDERAYTQVYDDAKSDGKEVEFLIALLMNKIIRLQHAAYHIIRPGFSQNIFARNTIKVSCKLECERKHHTRVCSRVGSLLPRR